MEFGWDPNKRNRTLAERGIDFAGILEAFEDPARRIAQDTRKDYREERYNMLARCRGRVFHITFTLRGELTWIISTRKANKREQRRYEQT
jgi:uncharacterized DUF497 family protein